MKKHFLHVPLWTFLSLALWMTGCGDDNDYADVDGQSPTLAFTAQHVQSATGRIFTVAGKVTDADGIATIRLVCSDLYLDKTIDLIEIYGEPQTSYDLSYNFTTKANELGERFTIAVTVTDVGGRSVTQDVLVTMDGDFENPTFVSGAPDDGGLLPVILREGETPTLELNIALSDDRGLDYIEVDIEGIDGFPDRKELNAQAEGTYTRTVTFPFDVQEYSYTVAVADTAGKIVTRAATINVTDVMDYEKMYLSDVATEAELTADVFGVPMCIDHTGEYQYQAIYYNAQAGTEVYFLPVASSFSVRYGINSSDESRLTNDPALLTPFILDEPNAYYVINIDILNLTYEFVKTYPASEAQDPWPTSMVYGTATMDKWNDGGSTMMDFTFGLTSTNPTEVVAFTQDTTNPHIFYSEPMDLASGEQMNFIIHNYHTDQWWNFVRWCSISDTDLDVFGYYTGSAFKNPDYTGPTNQNDVWSKPTVTTGGTYRFYFDSHLGRAKLIRE